MRAHNRVIYVEHTEEPDILKGHNPEDTFQKAIKQEIALMLDDQKSKGYLVNYFILEYFGLDLAVAMKRPNGRSSIRFLELKAFVGSRQGGVGFGDRCGEGSQVDLLILAGQQPALCDRFVRWILVDGTKPKGSNRYVIFNNKQAENAAMGGVRKGKQNNLRVNDLLKYGTTWDRLLEEIAYFLTS